MKQMPTRMRNKVRGIRPTMMTDEELADALLKAPMNDVPYWWAVLYEAARRLRER